MNNPICPGCDKPMISGQALNGLYGCHWDCTDNVRTAELDDKAQDTIDARKKHDQEKARAVLEERMPHVLEHQVLGAVIDRVDAQFAKLEELIAQLPDEPLHPHYSCMIEKRDVIVCYDTKGSEGKPGFAICKDFDGVGAGSVVLSVEDSQALSDQLVSFQVSQMDPECLDLCLSCAYEPLDKLVVFQYIGKDREKETLAIAMRCDQDDEVHLDRGSVKALRDRLNQFLELTK